MRQALVPVGNGDAVGLFDFALVEHAVEGAVCPAGVLVAADGFHPAGDAGQTVDGDGEVVPAAGPFVGEVVDARHEGLGREHGKDGAGQVGGTGGGAYLVGYDRELVALGAQPHHGLHEVIAVGRVEPGGTDDGTLGAESHQGLFALEFGGAVDRLGVGRHILGVGAVSPSVEYVVGRDVYHAGPAGCGGTGQVLDGRGVDFAAQLHVVFGLVDLGIGGTVHDVVHAVVGDSLVHGFGIADVEFGYVGEDGFEAVITIQYVAHLVAQLAVCAGNKNSFCHGSYLFF